MTEVYGKQDKLVRKGKQESLNAGHRTAVQERLNVRDQL